MTIEESSLEILNLSQDVEILQQRVKALSKTYTTFQEEVSDLRTLLEGLEGELQERLRIRPSRN